MRSSFPLQWPPGWGRTPPPDRESSRFVTGMARALRECLHELERLGAANVVITSDLPTRSNGLPYGDAPDTGIAIWFVLRGEERVLACDRWKRPAENLHAIGLTVQALRGIERWGAGDMVNRAFQGFQALPAPAGTRRTWWAVLCLQRDVLELPMATLARARRAHRILIKHAHPDKEGGSDIVAAEINAAMDEAVAELTAMEAERAAHANRKNGHAPA
jgi:hypothetical protein